jgi:outer membrane receptor protein involved in Fe transport
MATPCPVVKLASSEQGGQVAPPLRTEESALYHAKRRFRRAPGALAVAAALAAVAGGATAEEEKRRSLELPTVEVVGTTPVPGLGTPVDQVPGNVQANTSRDVQRQESVTLPDFLESAATGVSANYIQGNPYQPDVNYRGFTASPLLGTPQGLSVYQDGVRINEAFGDTVNWDLIPLGAISNINLIPGSNPLFGLNTLGGALFLHTKTGADFPNTRIEGYGGSFGRTALAAEQGGYRGDFDYYVYGNWFEEDGWRDFSPSKVKQFLAKVGQETREFDWDLSLTLANTDLTGNGLVPESMLRQNRAQVFSVPDNTRNDFQMWNFTGGYWLSDSRIVSGNVYYRRSDRKTLNGDANDDFEEDPALDGAEGANGGLGVNAQTAVNNTTSTEQTAYGAALLYTVIGKQNEFKAGASYDTSDADFTQSAQLGVFSPVRGVLVTDPLEVENSLTGETETWSVFLTDTYAITPRTHLTVSGRYNHTRVKNKDLLNPVAPNLDGDFTYTKFNPAVGITHSPMETLTLFAGYAQGNRAPTPIELGCADPDNPCTLPNALASDPFLEQVVARTFEVGARGRIGPDVRWNAAAYRTTNHDDIIFVGTTTSAGFFQNFGKTRRQGVELGLNGRHGRFSWFANYSYVDATFESSACLLAENNSSRGQSPVCTDTVAGTGDDLILVSPGNRIPGIPEHQFRLSGEYRFDDRLSLGVTLIAFSDQFVRGNENNAHQPGTFTDLLGDDRSFLGPGTVEGYGIVNLVVRYRLHPNWELFGRVDNVFDKEYSTAGALAENPFAAGVFQTNSDDWTREAFFAPGAPRAGWIGIRYLFDQDPRS